MKMTPIGKPHRVIRVWLAPLEWRIWPIYNKRVEPGAIYLGPLIIKWWMDWTR